MEFRVGTLAAADPSTPPDRLVLPAIPAEPAVGNTRLVSLNEMMSMMVPDPADPTLMFGPQSAMLGTMDLAAGAHDVPRPPSPRRRRPG